MILVEEYFNLESQSNGVSKHTNRDAVWDEALKYAISGDSFGFNEIQSVLEENISDDEIHNTIRAMADKKWLSMKESEDGVWKPGPRLNKKISGRDEGASDEDGSDKEEVDAIPLNDCNASGPSDLSSDEIYIGLVDRIVGGSGNAIIDIPEADGEVNLGPIDESSEGKEVLFKPDGGHWGRCLNEEYTYDTYDPRDGATDPSSKMRDRRKNPFKGSSQNTAPSDPTNLNKLLTGNQ